MNDVLMMVMAGCPHCQRAREIMAELRARRPEFRDVKVREVDETLAPDFVATLDYHYVPSFFVGGKKYHEGIPTAAAIEAVCRAALEGKPCEKA